MLEERGHAYGQSAENENERAAGCADAEVAASRRQQAAVWRRLAAHYQQAIDLLKAAPMPASVDTGAAQAVKDWDFIERVANPGVRR